MSVRVLTIHEFLPFFADPAGLLVIDLRSPKEFAKGHIPKAVNLPLLDNHERHVVGTLYKQEGKAAATEEGLSLFAKKAPEFLASIDNALCDKKTLVLYCWRGGMRSTMVARWLSVMGYQVFLVKGGYKSYRKEVLTLLDQLAQHSLIALHGKTGSGKTELLQELMAKDFPAIDLEGLAKHRGSTFGDLAQEDPPTTQQQFENDLALSYYALRGAKKILVEFETAIGPVYIGAKLRSNLHNSPMVFLTKSHQDRVQALVRIYTRDWNEEEEQRFFLRLEALKKSIAKQHIEEIGSAIRAKDFPKAVDLLLKERYDKCYQKSLARYEKQMLREIDLSNDREAGIAFLEQLLLT